MDTTLFAIAIPLFVLLIGVDVVFTRLQGLESYRFQDVIANLSCGIGSLITGAVGKLLGVAVYTVLWSYAAIWEWSAASFWTWAVAVLGVDLCFYTFHRASHRVNLFWAGHAVHHQSEDFNLSVALRQSWYEPMFAWVFDLPLALLGLPPVVYVTCSTVNTLYQFWIHTESIDRMGPLEWVMNTPSHHRAHHGVNPEYIDTNYAGMFIIWDRLFGTFEPEEADVVYGTIRPVASWNPAWVNAVKFVEIGRLVARARSWRDRLRLVLGPPEWRPEALGGPVEPPEIGEEPPAKYEVDTPPALQWYVAASFGLVAAAGVALATWQATLSVVQTVIAGLGLLVSVTTVGSILERRSWALALEKTRHAAAVPLVAWMSAGSAWMPAVVAGVAVLAVAMILWAGRLPVRSVR